MRWIYAFLADKSQWLVIDGEESDPIPVISDDPRDSVLVQILSLVYINDLLEGISSQVRPLIIALTSQLRTRKSAQHYKRTLMHFRCGSLIRICSTTRQSVSVTKLINKLGWRALEQRRADARLCLFYKVVYDLVAVPLPDHVQFNNRIPRYCHSVTFRQMSTSRDFYKCFLSPRYSFLGQSYAYIQLTLVISTSLISDNRLSRSENLVPA